MKKGAIVKKILWAIFATGVLFTSLGAIVIVGAFDKVITSKFEGKKWQIPSHVYARPLELYSGAKQSKELLEWELDKLGYREVEKISAPGQYKIADSVIGRNYQIYTRGFEFWDGVDKPQSINLKIVDDKVSLIRDSSGSMLSVIRFEPLRIGGIYPSNLEDRLLVNLDEVPGLLIETLITVEDKNFYQHYGISVVGILRALITNIREGRAVQGGSTITQQLVKNFYLNSERSLKRKIREAIMSLLLEYHYSKAEIIETYLNEVFFGQSGKRAIHGIGLASYYFFNQPVNELEVHQIALLVGMVKAPVQYNPWRFPQRAEKRRNLVLELLLRHQVIDEATYQQAVNKPLSVSKRPSLQLNPYPAMMDLLKMELREQYNAKDLAENGLVFYTSLDPQIQRVVEISIQQRLAHIEEDYKFEPNSLQSAVIVTQIGTGEIVAVAGDRQAGYSGFNRAINAVRPIGSLIKPFTYTAALQQGNAYRLSTLVDDTEFTIPAPNNSQWSPKNYDKKERGPIALITALAKSLNLPAARVGLDIGIESVTGMLQSLGVERPVANYPSTLLGASALSPLEVATAYHSLANDGFYVPLKILRAVYQADGKPLARKGHAIEQRVDADIVFLIKYAMQQVFETGTSKRAYKEIDKAIRLAGKTGTTDDLRDVWIAAFGGNYSTVVWVGRDDNKTTHLTSTSGALPIWTQIMAIIESQGVGTTQSENIHFKWVDITSDRLSAPNCPNATLLPFIKGTEPTRYSDNCSHRQIKRAQHEQSSEQRKLFNEHLKQPKESKTNPSKSPKPSRPWWKRLGF